MIQNLLNQFAAIGCALCRASALGDPRWWIPHHTGLCERTKADVKWSGLKWCCIGRCFGMNHQTRIAQVGFIAVKLHECFGDAGTVRDSQPRESQAHDLIDVVPDQVQALAGDVYLTVFTLFACRVLANADLAAL